MSREKILIVEDEEDICEVLKYNLQKEGYRISIASSGEETLKTARYWQPHLILLDLMLPGIDGLEVCKILKNDRLTKSIPVIILTAKSGESDIISGLELGADDYITKPFSPKVLVARVRTTLRRKLQKTLDTAEPIQIQELEIHPGRREVLIGDEPIDLTYTEFQILYLLTSRPGWVYTRFQIVEAVRGEDYYVTDRSVDVQIAGLRKKLGDYGRLIVTVRGVGYRFQDQQPHL